MAKPGPKELQRRAFREALAVPSNRLLLPPKDMKMIFESPPCMGHSKPKKDPMPAPPPAAKQETTDVKKPKTSKTKKTTSKRKPAAKAKNVKAAAVKTTKQKKPAARKGVPATDVGAMICREGGASMEDLVEKFGIDAHPMRAKIHYLKHKLGYKIKAKDGRYTGTAPAA